MLLDHTVSDLRLYLYFLMVLRVALDVWVVWQERGVRLTISPACAWSAVRQRERACMSYMSMFQALSLMCLQYYRMLPRSSMCPVCSLRHAFDHPCGTSRPAATALRRAPSRQRAPTGLLGAVQGRRDVGSRELALRSSPLLVRAGTV